MDIFLLYDAMDVNKEMGNTSIDPYEHQLLEMFKSCDSKESGFLDCKGLERLCDKLHLDEAKDQLIECLLVGKTTVTFPEFRDALLALLGSGLKQTDDSRDPSPEREVSPKFVFGQKKYGRRSRPESTDQESGGQDIKVDEDDFDTFLPPSDEISRVNLVQKSPEKIQREDEQVFFHKEMESPCSRGQPQGDVELRAAWERLGVGSDGYLDQEELALVCRAVGMERAADEIVNEVFSKLDCDGDGRISFDEFLQLFRGGGPTMPPSPQHSNPMQSSSSSSSPPPYHPHQLTSLDVNSSGYVSADSVVELWEMSGVPGATTLLQELGLSGVHEINLSLLNNILDEELRNLRADIAKLSVSPLVTYLSAALSLSHVHIKQLKTSLEQMTGERAKLRSDLAEANHRASLIAQEVDDRHARMERSTQIQVKLLEQRHAEQVKQLSVQLVSEREQLTATTLRLEKKLADVQEEETKLRSEMATLQSEFSNMEKENRNLIEQLSDYDMAHKRAEEQEQKLQTLQLRLTELETNNDQVASLVEQLTELKEENTKLRDRNDELTMQVESLSTRLSNRKQGSSVSLEGGGGGTKRRGHSPPGTLLDSGSWGSISPSPRQGKVRRCCTENDLSLDNVRMEGLAICQPLRHSESGLGAEIDTLEDSLTLSNCSDTTISFKVGSDASKEADVEKLQAHIIELERMIEQYRLKLAVTNNNDI